MLQTFFIQRALKGKLGTQGTWALKALRHSGNWALKVLKEPYLADSF